MAGAMMATPAMAAKQVNAEVGLNQTAPGVFTGTFGNTVNNNQFESNVDANLFYTDTYQFTVPDIGKVGASAVTLTFDGTLTFTEILLNGTALKINQVLDGGNNVVGYSAISPLGGLASAANPQKLSVTGRLTGTTGTYTGNVRFETAVPEPGTWALMILGFGVVGYAMRRRPSVRFAQAI
ncbi:FxDxF family PEP-CTERM protein [Sphingomonas sp. Leaf231]|uniref:FxDxF family PEP-CTERM protein n=1 Tax=Sphingomonas sp. Leaf231 TaxID=1736301 RepID=UPI00138F8ABB|nr:FxDxF family PEP-CTERM protein [Sphingomonas sp. Leaf231]